MYCMVQISSSRPIHITVYYREFSVCRKLGHRAYSQRLKILPILTTTWLNILALLRVPVLEKASLGFI